MRHGAHVLASIAVLAGAALAVPHVAHAETFQQWVAQVFPVSTRVIYYTKPTIPPGPAPRGTRWVVLSWQQQMA